MPSADLSYIILLGTVSRHELYTILLGGQCRQGPRVSPALSKASKCMKVHPGPADATADVMHLLLPFVVIRVCSAGDDPYTELMRY